MSKKDSTVKSIDRQTQETDEIVYWNWWLFTSYRIDAVEDQTQYYNQDSK